MNANNDNLIEGELVYKIVGAAMAVHNSLGAGFREKTYECGLCVEFDHLGIKFSQQIAFPIVYRGVQIDNYIPDLIAENRVLIDAKTIPMITDVERGQMLNYLRVTKLQVGLIINFKNAKLEWERIILTR